MSKEQQEINCRREPTRARAGTGWTGKQIIVLNKNAKKGINTSHADRNS